MYNCFFVDCFGMIIFLLSYYITAFSLMYLYFLFLGANLHFRIRTPLRAVQIRKWRRLFRAFKGLEPKHRFLSIWLTRTPTLPKLKKWVFKKTAFIFSRILKKKGCFVLNNSFENFKWLLEFQVRSVWFELGLRPYISLILSALINLFPGWFFRNLFSVKIFVAWEIFAFVYRAVFPTKL